MPFRFLKGDAPPMSGPVLKQTGIARIQMLVALLFFMSPLLTLAQNKYSALTQKVTFADGTAAASALLESLHRQTGYVFTYDEPVFSSIHLEGLDFQKTTLGTVLFFLQDRYGFEFLVGERNIAVKRRPSFQRKEPGKKKVEGHITDAKTRKPLSGVSISVQGEAGGAFTDEEGKFRIEVMDSTTVLVYSMVGYSTRFLKVGKDSMLNLVLTTDSRTLGGVTVEARRRANTEVAVLRERQHAAVVSDGISAQNIEKTASITTVQALQRVTGVTISNDRNVAIRGLGDRNVVAQLNGARLSSSNPDQNSPPLDLVPAGLLESITVYKTLTPDKPADATAGIIELKTKSIPEKFTLVVTAQMGTNTTTGIGGSFTSFKGSELGPFGQQVKQRDLPANFYKLSSQFPQGSSQLYRYYYDSRNSPDMTATANAIDKMQKSISPVLMNSYRAAAPNQIYTVGIGNTFHFKNEQALGLVLGLNYYKRTVEKNNGTVNQYSIYQGSALTPPVIPAYTDPNNLNLGKFAGYKENTGNEQLNFGGLATVTYRLNRRNEVSANFMLNRGAEEGATHLDGRYDNTGGLYSVTNQVYQLNQSYRTFNTIQFRGEHKLTGGEYSPQVSWNISGSRATELDPDNRFFSLIADSSVYNGSILGNIGASHDQLDAHYYRPLRSSVSGVLNGYTINVDPNGRKYRSLTEDNRNYTLDLSIPFHWLANRQVFKLGGYYLRKQRDFSEYILYLPDQLSNGNQSDQAFANLFPFHGNLNAYVAPGRIGFANDYSNEGAARSVGFLYYPQKTFNNYSGYQDVGATYAMLDLRPVSQLRLTGGVRLESTNIRGSLDTVGASTDPMVYGYQRQGGIVSAYKPGFKPFFSGALTYTPREDMNWRLAYTTTLARPELRELMPTIVFDPFQYAVVAGNPALVNQQTRNMDFRWEWFPRAGEVYSVSAFYKEIEHQLTNVFSTDSGMLHSSGPVYNIIRYENDPEKGKVYGLEFEVRKDLGLTFPALRNFFAGVNAMLARSIIRKNPERILASRTIDPYSSVYSPVFEQPPYSLNAYLDYDNRKSGTDLTLNFNVVGPRLVQVRMTGEPDIYDHPVPVLDLVFTQRLDSRFTMKAFAKNILDPPVSKYYATPGGSYTKFAGKTYLNTSYRQGMEIALGVTYNVF